MEQQRLSMKIHNLGNNDEQGLKYNYRKFSWSLTLNVALTTASGAPDFQGNSSRRHLRQLS